MYWRETSASLVANVLLVSLSAAGIKNWRQA
jgi:hypothetical protein